MNLKGKKIIALLLAFVLAFTNNNVVSVALEVRDGETLLEAPDGLRWQQETIDVTGEPLQEGYEPGLIINLFDNTYAEEGLTVNLENEDLNSAGHEDEVSGEWIEDYQKAYVFLNGTEATGNCSEFDNATIMADKDSSFVDENGVLEFVGGEYDPSVLGSEYPDNPNVDFTDRGNPVYALDVSSNNIAGIVPNMLGMLEENPAAESLYVVYPRPTGEIYVAYDNWYDPEIDPYQALVEYSLDGGNSYAPVNAYDVFYYTDRETGAVPASVIFRLTPPAMYAELTDHEPMVEIYFDDNPANNWYSYGEGHVINLTKNENDGKFYFTYTPVSSEDRKSFDVNVFWSDYYKYSGGDEFFNVQSVYDNGTITSNYDEQWGVGRHPESLGFPDEKRCFNLSEILSDGVVTFNIQPYENYTLDKFSINYNEVNHTYFFADSVWDEGGAVRGVTVAAGESGSYNVSFAPEFFTVNKWIFLEANNVDEGKFEAFFDGDNGALVEYKVGSAGSYTTAWGPDFFIVGEELKSIEFKMRVPEKYRGKNIVPMIELCGADSLYYTNFGESPNIPESAITVDENGDYHYTFTPVDATSFDFRVFWSPYYMAECDRNTQFMVRSEVFDGEAGVSQNPGASDIYSHPTEAGLPYAEKYVLAKPSGTNAVIINYSLFEGYSLDRIEVDCDQYHLEWHEGDSNEVISRREDGSYDVAITNGVLGSGDFDVDIRVFACSVYGGSIDVHYDPMSKAEVQYRIGEGSYSHLNADDKINYIIDENGQVLDNVSLLVTPPDFYLGKNIEPIMVFPEELSDCVVMTRDGDKYLYTFTPPTGETPSFRVDFIWSDFYAWNIDWSSQFKIESQIVDGNGNIIVSPNPGESNTYRHPEVAQMNGQEIRVFDLNTDITYTLTPNANCYVSEIEIRREEEGSNNIDVAYTFDESQVGGKWVLWDETNPGMVTESTSAEGCYVITIPGSNAWGNYYISVRFKQGQSGIKGGSDDFKGAKKILEGTNFGYAGSKDDIEADLEWELWYSYFGYMKSRDSEGTFYGMFGTVNKEDNSKADNGDYRDERKPYAIDYTGPSEAFKKAVTLSEGTSTTGSVVDGLPYYTYMVDFKNCSAWTSGAPESAEGKVYVLSNYTDIVVGFKNDTGVTNYQVVDASFSSFDGRTTVYGDYGENGTVIIFGNGAGSVGSTSREEEKQYRFSIHVTQELSNMHMRRSYQIETAPPQPGSDFNAQVNEGKPGINCNLGIVNTIIEGFEVTPHYEKGTAAAWGWTDWPLYWTNGSSESNPIVFEMYKGCTWLEINSLDNESRPSITNIECTLPYAGKAVKIEKNETTYKFTLLSDYYDEIPLKITYSNSKVGYATLRFVAIDIQRGRTIWHGTDNSKDAGNDSVITASYYYLSDQTMTVNLFATLTLGDGSVVTKTVTPYGARVTDANQGTNQVDDFIVWKQGDTPSMPIKVEVIAIVPDSGDSFGGALIGSGSGVCKVFE